MSIESHANINAAGLAADLTEAFMKHLRGDAGNNVEAAFQVFHSKVVSFITELSEALDKRFHN